jgi:hypothetical protein
MSTLNLENDMRNERIKEVSRLTISNQIFVRSLICSCVSGWGMSMRALASLEEMSIAITASLALKQ